jgi:hypothetical protein
MDEKQEFSADDGRQQAKGLKQKVASEAERAKSKLAEAAAPVKAQARDFAERQKRAGAEQIGGVARAVHGAAEKLEEDLPFAAEYVRQAADSLEGAADTLQQKSVDDIARSVADFARQQPVAFLGGAVLAGFVLARFLKSSAEPDAASAGAGSRAYATAGM